MKYLIVFFLLTATIFRLFTDLDKPLEKWDEETNANVVKNTLENKTWPFLIYKNKPFLEKPPLWYYLNIFLASVKDDSVITFRLVSVSSALIIIFLCVYISILNWNLTAGLITWFFLLLPNQLYVNNAGGFFSSHTFKSADLDCLQIMFMISVLAVYYRIKNLNFSWILIGLLTGLGFLTKGPIAIIPTIIIIINNKSIKSKHPVQALCIFFTLILIWYTLMLAAYGSNFLKIHFGYHVFERTFRPIEGHINYWWYPISVLSVTAPIFYLSYFLSVALFISKKNIFSDKKPAAVFWMSVVFLILPVAVRTKLAWYLLPFYPFASIFIGFIFSNILHDIVYNIKICRIGCRLLVK